MRPAEKKVVGVQERFKPPEGDGERTKPQESDEEHIKSRHSLRVCKRLLDTGR